MTRFSELTPENWNDAQRRVANDIVSGPRRALRGPFVPLLHSPGLTDPLQRVGEYLRFHSAVPGTLNDLAILVSARQCTSQFEWIVHRSLAIAAGLDVAIINQIAVGQRPEGLSAEQAAVYDFCTELHRTFHVRDETFYAVLRHLGERGAVDLVGICGYYMLLAMILNVAQVPLPDGQSPALEPL